MHGPWRGGWPRGVADQPLPSLGAAMVFDPVPRDFAECAVVYALALWTLVAQD